MKLTIKSSVAGLTLLAFASSVSAADCFVEEAAKTALDREIELIKATATDVDSTFNGPEGCIDSSIFNDFDLSIAIPDLAGLLSNVSGNLIQGAIDAAKQKVCKKINDQIGDVVGKAKGATNNFSSGLSDELKGVLDNGWGDINL